MIKVQNLIQLLKIIVSKQMTLKAVTAELGDLFEIELISEIHQAIKTNNNTNLQATAFNCTNHLQSIEKYKKFCSKALRKDGRALRFVDEQFPDDFHFYLTPVRDNGEALEYVPILTNGYDTVCMEAVTTTPAAVQFVKRFLPYDVRKKIFLTAVSLDGLALEYILCAQSDTDICRVAIENNIYALEFVDEALRQELIVSGEAEYYLEKNYMSHAYFSPQQQKFADFLARIEHVIVFNKQDLADKELDDARAVYARSPKRSGRITSIATEDLNTLLTQMQERYRQERNIHLLILGHANVKVEKIAGLSTADIIDILEKYPLINRLTLFGCKSAQAYKLEKEKEIIRKVSHEKSLESPPHYGLLMVTGADSKSPEKLLRIAKVQAMFVIVLLSSDCFLRHIKKSNDRIHVEDSRPLEMEDIVTLQNTFNKKRSLHSVFRKRMTICTMKNSQKPLKPIELEILNQFFSKDKFSRLSPIYSESKTKYPFLQCIQITPEECEQKLTSSLLQKLVREITKNAEITHPLMVKGYSNIIHVDRKEARFRVLPDLSYTKGYYQHGWFKDPTQDNLDRKKVLTQQQKMVQEIENGYEDGETLTKAIQVVINSPYQNLDR